MARPPNQVRRMCNYCGHDYPQPIWLVGMPRCPNCYHRENCRYHDGQGHILRDYIPEEELQRLHALEDWPKHEDVGCKTATRRIGRQCKCIECPLEFCLEEISQKQIVYIRHQKTITDVFAMHDGGFRIVDISRKLSTPTSTIHHWLKRRKKIEAILQLPSGVFSNQGVR